MGASDDASFLCKFANLGQGDFEVLANVVAQRFQRRHVDNARFVRQRAGAGFAHQLIEADQKCRECFAGPGGRGDQDIVAAADRRPALDLRFGGLPNCSPNHSSISGSNGSPA